MSADTSRAGDIVVHRIGFGRCALLAAGLLPDRGVVSWQVAAGRGLGMTVMIATDTAPSPASPSVGDERLMSRLAASRPEAQGPIHGRYAAPVYGLAARSLDRTTAGGIRVPGHDMRSHATMKLTFRGVPALATLGAAVLAGAFTTVAQDGDDSPVHKIMGQVHTRNRAIGKRLRSPTVLEAAGRKSMAADAASLIRLGKEARALAGPARERKKSLQDWIRAVDDFLRASEDFARIIADGGSARPQATRSYQQLQKTCTNCHRAFREE